LTDQNANDCRAGASAADFQNSPLLSVDRAILCSMSKSIAAAAARGDN
jgi:hypothetical protein